MCVCVCVCEERERAIKQRLWCLQIYRFSDCRRKASHHVTPPNLLKNQATATLDFFWTQDDVRLDISLVCERMSINTLELDLGDF